MIMDPMYHDMMMSYQTCEAYPPQALPVSLSLTEYTLPTPPNSPLQITDLSGSLMGQKQMSDPTQSLAMDLSLTDHGEQTFPHLFERDLFEKDIFNEFPDILTNTFGPIPSSFDTDIFDEYAPSPTPSPVYEHCTFIAPQESHPLNNYIHQVRATPDSGGDDSDIDSSLSDDSFVVPHTNQRQDAYYTPVIHYGPLTEQERTHNYQIRTDPISIPDLTGHGSSGRVKKIRPTKHKKKCITSSSDDSDDYEHKPTTKSTRGRGRREAMKGNHLWEFIRDLLKNKTTCPRIIRWENRQEGVFRFVNSEAVAGLWGSKKNNPKMNYEKLSRAMRYYYKREILERVDGRRLVYKFGCNAEGWKEAAAELTEDE